MTTQAMVILNDIRKADDIFQANFRNGDAASLAALYTEKGMLLPGGSDFIEGKKAIRDFWQGVMDMGIKEARLDTRETELCGDTAIEVGEYTLRGGGGEVLDYGKYIVIWKQEEDQWKLHRDIWNTSMPAQKS